MKTILLALCSIVLAAPAQIIYKPVPRMQALPLPHHEISFQRDGVELTRFHFDPADKRPFLYPMNGPSGRSLTRMGHPHDPVTHSHHNSLWLSHHIVNGIDFWGDGPRGHIRVTRIEQLTDDDDAASVTALISWGETNKVLLWERRRITVQALASNEWILTLDTRFDAAREPVTLGKTPFGLAAVRMANSIGVHDGGGMIRNSEGGVNETNIFWKPARWVDYSGAILWQVPTDTNQMRPRIGAIVRDARVPVWEGITFLDHPKNPNHPSHFHVRDDGWMGASLTFSNALVIETNRPLQLRYGFYVHSGLTATNTLNQRWTEFSKTVLPDLTARRR